jgi:hypothetical protein
MRTGCHPLRRAMAVILGAASAQCASSASTSGSLKTSGAAEQSESSQPLSRTELIVSSSTQTNRGNVLHMMVRSLDFDTAATTTESYDDATAMLFAKTRDPDVVAAQPIIPGHEARLELKEPENHSVVLYFFFTDPGESWRVQLASPPPQEVRVELGANEVANVDVER